MIRKYFVPALMAAALLTGCQAPQGKDSYNEALSLKRANSVADAWAEGAHVPRSNLVTRGLGKKYPIASNDTAAGRAENRRVTVVISTP